MNIGNNITYKTKSMRKITTTASDNLWTFLCKHNLSFKNDLLNVLVELNPETIRYIIKPY